MLGIYSPSVKDFLFFKLHLHCYRDKDELAAPALEVLHAGQDAGAARRCS